MNKLILNIGLNVGDTEPVNQLSKTLGQLDSHFNYSDIIDIKVSENTGSWGKERVLVLEIKTILDAYYLFERGLEKLCDKLNQDAIAFTFNDVGYIAFNPNYKGEKFVFNPDYFKVFGEQDKKLTTP